MLKYLKIKCDTFVRGHLIQKVRDYCYLTEYFRLTLQTFKLPPHNRPQRTQIRFLSVEKRINS